MKRTMVGGLISLLAIGVALSAMADPPGGDRRPSGGAHPGGGAPGLGGPGRPGGGGMPMPGRPGPGAGGHRPSPSPPTHRPSTGAGHRPPSGPGHRPSPRPVHRTANRGIYGWNGHRYRAGAFRYPAGYAYRRWSIGQALPSLLFSSAYYFTNYAVLGLDAPPWGFQWVRYGPDVLLVNIRTGEILDVIHNAFY